MSNIFSHLLHARHSKTLLRSPSSTDGYMAPTSKWWAMKQANGNHFAELLGFYGVGGGRDGCTSPSCCSLRCVLPFPLFHLYLQATFTALTPHNKSQCIRHPAKTEIFKVKEFVSLAPSIMLLPCGSLINMHSKIKCKRLNEKNGSNPRSIVLKL